MMRSEQVSAPALFAMPHDVGARIWLLALLLFAFFLYTLGLQRNLPYANEADENIYVERALLMADSGDLNPHWFGNPGSTVIYPLAGIYALWFRVSGWGANSPPYPRLIDWLYAEPWQFYWLGRYGNVAVTLLSFALLYQVGRRLFDATTGLIAVAFTLTHPTLLYYAKLVRTDNIALCFGLLTLYAGLALYRQPATHRQIIAGAMVGLGVASRYFQILFWPFLLYINLLHYLASPRKAQQLRTFFVNLFLSGVATVVTFFVATPFFALDFATAQQNIGLEARTTHPGADGLSPLGNAIWYLHEVVFDPQQQLAVLLLFIGMATALWRRHRLALGLLGTAIIFIAGISTSALHWQRWLIPILPLLALLSAYGLTNSLARLTRLWPASWLRADWLLVGCTAIVISNAGVASLFLSIRDANPTTRVWAREWILANLPVDARIVQEPYTALLPASATVTNLGFSVGTEHTLQAYQQEGYAYIVISSQMYDRFLREPVKYPQENALYQQLISAETLVALFTPSRLRGGPTIRIYALPARQ